MKNTTLLSAIAVIIVLSVPLFAYSNPFGGGFPVEIPIPNISQEQQNRQTYAKDNLKPDLIFYGVGIANSSQGEVKNASFSLFINVDVSYTTVADSVRKYRQQSQIRDELISNSSITYVGALQLGNSIYQVKPLTIDETIGLIEVYLYLNSSFSEVVGNISINTTQRTANMYVSEISWSVSF